MSMNPLVVGPTDGPVSVWSGVWIAEDIEQIGRGIRSGGWIDGTLGMVGAGLDGLALVSDPVGTLLQYGVAWLIEHVRPLSQALDWLAGDPGAIAAQAQTWRNVAASLQSESDTLAQAVRDDLTEWSGAASQAYRGWVDARVRSLQGLGSAAETTAAIVEGAGALVGTVRMMVRDAVATVVSRLAVYAAELVGTVGLATPLVVEQVSTLCATWAARIAHWLHGLIASIRRLMQESARLGDLVDALTRMLGMESRHGPRGPQRDGEPPSTIGGPKEFDPDELRGLTADEVASRIPSDWHVRRSKSGGGIVHEDPANRGRHIRVMPGYAAGSRTDPLTWGPYVKVCQNGMAYKLPLAGNPTL
jgi:uncharacterized protein YukE